jgi:hypothetical protein
VVTQQSVRQVARRATMNGRRARAERERRLENLAIDVLVAIRRRDSAILEAEAAAGEALRAMLDGEGLSLRAAVEWCGGEITVREASRLRRVGRSQPDAFARETLASATDVGVHEVSIVDGGGAG